MNLNRSAVTLALILAAAPFVCRADDEPRNPPPAAITPGPTLPDPVAALAGIDDVIIKALADQKIPGASVAVIVNDKVVLLKGYGLRNVESNLPFTPDTLIPIASVSKQFTVAGLATLVRQGKLDWDKPVREYMPDFRVGDDYATLKATPRDLVTHRIGMPRHDWARFATTLDRATLYQRLRHLNFSADIRTRFQYNNFMFMTAGYLGGKVAGTSWEQLTRDALFVPLGMNRSTFTLKDLVADADHATGYRMDNDRSLKPFPFPSFEALAPAGGIISSARDLTSYMRMMLDEGRFAGRPVLQPADVAAMMEPQVPVGPSEFADVNGFKSSGMGLFVHTYRGHEIAEHGGNTPGAACSVLFVPKHKIGVVVLTNRSGAVLRDGLPYEIVDRLLGLASARMIERNAEFETKGFAQEDAAKAENATDRRPNTKPSHDLDDYAGRYNHPGYGDIDVGFADNALWMTFNAHKARLDHWHYDSFQTPEARTTRLDRIRVMFVTDLSGDVESFEVAFEPQVEPIRFSRVAPTEMMERNFLERFTGVFDTGGVDTVVRINDAGKLETEVLGAIDELEPVRGTIFRIKNAKGVKIEFLSGPDGTVNRLALHERGTTIAPKKK